MRADAAADPASLIPDCSGACLPGPGGSTADALNAHLVYRLREKGLRLIARCLDVGGPATRRYLQTVHDTLAALPAHAALAVLRHPLLHLQLSPERIAEDPLGSALGLGRFLIGASGVESLVLVIPPEGCPPAGLYLPHLHAFLEPAAGPIVVQATAADVRLTCVDGFSATLPVGGVPEGGAVASSRLRIGRRAADWPVLNGLPEILGPPVNLSPEPDPDPGAGDLQILEDGFDLLREVWPEAYAATRRFLQGALIQPCGEGHTTSITTNKLHGAFIASLRDPVQVADALCHEGSHTRFGVFLTFDPLIQDDGAAVHPSPWRKDPRPLKGVLNGIHAFVNVCLFYRRVIPHLADARAAEGILSEQRAKVLAGWDYFAPRAVPTRVGAMVLADVEAAVKSL